MVSALPCTHSGGLAGCDVLYSLNSVVLSSVVDVSRVCVCACVSPVLAQVDADDFSSTSTVVDISGGDFYLDFEEVRATPCQK